MLERVELTGLEPVTPTLPERGPRSCDLSVAGQLVHRTAWAVLVGLRWLNLAVIVIDRVSTVERSRASRAVEAPAAAPCPDASSRERTCRPRDVHRVTPTASAGKRHIEPLRELRVTRRKIAVVGRQAEQPHRQVEVPTVELDPSSGRQRSTLRHLAHSWFVRPAPANERTPDGADLASARREVPPAPTRSSTGATAPLLSSRRCWAASLWRYRRQY